MDSELEVVVVVGKQKKLPLVNDLNTAESQLVYM